MKIEKLVPDSSIITEGVLSRKINDKEIEADEIIIHDGLLAILEYLADNNKAHGFLGLDELDRLSELLKQGINIRFAGIKPRFSEMEHLKLDDIDSLILDLAYSEDAVLITTRTILERVAKAKGMRVMLITPSKKPRKIKLEEYFDDVTMSVHLREEVYPYAKKGCPGNWTFEAVTKKKLTQDDIKSISREIIEEASIRTDGFVEIERPGSTIIQLGKYRIVITKPPFSDGWEITAVRPVKKLILEEYNLSEKLMQRVTEQAEGVLIAGAPGMGKTTFAAALAEFYAGKDKIVKTVEAPRDLVLPDKITQYSISHGDAQEIHDILLLSRPDYTFFDEMRNTDDFRLFADLRLAGIGFIGVVHATKPIDAIQRFVGRIELGVIPQVIDTVIFIKNGRIEKVLSLRMVVKVPSGMTEADLARPVVVVNDFETKKLEYELYSYGEETVVIPVQAEQQTGAKNLASKQIQSVMKRYCRDVEVDVVGENKAVVYVPNEDIPFVIGKQGKNITEIEKQLGISIDVQPLNLKKEKKSGAGVPIEYNVSIGKNNILFEVSSEHIGRDVTVVVNGDYLLTAKISKKSHLNIKKDNKIGKIIVEAINMGEKIELVS